MQKKSEPSSVESQTTEKQNPSKEASHKIYNLVIGLSGPYGSGCSSLAEELVRILNDWPGCKAEKISVSRLIDFWTDRFWGKNRQVVEHKGKTGKGDDTDRRDRLQVAGTKLRSSIEKEIIGKIIAHEIKTRGEDFESHSNIEGVGTLVFVVDSLKNYSDLKALRKIYKDEFFFCFVNANTEIRWQRMRNYKSWDENKKADFQKLDAIDSDEKLIHPEVNGYGQQVKKLAAHADYYFVNNSTRENLRDSAYRLTCLLFGYGISQPKNDERCMHLAFSSANNSACLSRQVGAAIFTSEGNILAVGHNDVPRSKGGLYSVEDINDHRCLNVGDRRCINDTNKEERFFKLAENIFENIKKQPGVKDIDEIRNNILDVIKRSEFKDATEYCRAVHAEMDALMSVCRNLSGSTIGATIYVTTQPCHNCTKHLICAGIRRAVYIEPYPKSLGEELHSDAITLNPQTDNTCDGKIAFVPYQGIAPRRFHDIFDMDEKRKDSEGKMCYTDKNTIAFSPKFAKKTEKRLRKPEDNESIGVSLNELIASQAITIELRKNQEKEDHKEKEK